MKNPEELSKLKIEFDDINRKLAELTEEELQLIYGGAPLMGGGRYVWPVPGFNNVVSTFTDDLSRGSNNMGITIAGSGIEGAGVVAAAEGTVNPTFFCKDGFGGGLGTYCQIDHEGGKATLYAHLENVLVDPGQHVFQGQVIGYVGRTGDTQVPCLRFVTKMFGCCYDPMDEY